MNELTPEQRIARLRARRGETAEAAVTEATSGTAAPTSSAPARPLPPPTAAAPLVTAPPPVATSAIPTGPSARQRFVMAVRGYQPRAHPARPARRVIGVAAGAGFLAMLPMMGSLTAAPAEGSEPTAPPDGAPLAAVGTVQAGLPGGVSTSIVPVAIADAVTVGSSPTAIPGAMTATGKFDIGVPNLTPVGTPAPTGVADHRSRGPERSRSAG